MDYVHSIAAVILAVVLGAAVGFEREMSGKSAGLRTNILICLGAAVFTLISRGMSGPDDSITRIAAQVVTGVGFLGAGAIIRDTDGVHGLTTAATIWMVASIGMACGANMYLLAVISTFIVLIVLYGLGKADKFIKRFSKKQNSNKTDID